MTYQDKKAKIVVIEMFGAYEATRRGLKEHGYSFTERDIFSTFWGIQFIVEKPRGKDATKRLNFLFTDFWKAYEGWAR